MYWDVSFVLIFVKCDLIPNVNVRNEFVMILENMYNDMFHQSKSRSSLLGWSCKLLLTCNYCFSRVLVLSPNGQKGKLLGLKN